MRKNMIVWINKYINTEREKGESFINKISIEEKEPKTNKKTNKNIIKI